jgi:hypothetical protein
MNIPQLSFAKGEVAPELHARYDLAFWGAALKKCENFFIKPAGGAVRRGGLRAVYKTKYQDKLAVLVPFIFNNQQSFQIEFGDGYCRFYNEEGIILDADNSPIETYTPYTEDDLRNLYYHQSADVIFIACNGHRHHTLTRYSNADWRFEPFQYANEPLTVPNYDEDKKIYIEYYADSDTLRLTSAAPIFDADEVLYVIEKNIDPTSGTFQFGTGLNHKYMGLCNNEWNLFTTNTWTGSIFIEYSLDKIRWEKIREFSAQGNQNFSAAGDLPVDICHLRITTLISAGTITGNFNIDNNPAKIHIRTYAAGANKLSAFGRIESEVAGIAPIIFTKESRAPANLIPDMTSNTEPSGAAAFNGREDAWKAFSASEYLNLEGHGIPETISYEFDEEKFITSYSFQLAPLYLTLIGGEPRRVGIETKLINAEGATVLREDFYIYGTSNSYGSYIRSIAATSAKKIQITFSLTAFTVWVHVKQAQVNGYGAEDTASEGYAGWQKGEWNDKDGYPSKVFIFQNRLCWAKGSVVNASESGSYKSYKTSTPLLDSDAVSSGLMSLNDITALTGLKRLIAFTGDGCYGNNGETLTPAASALPKQNSFSAADIMPILFADRIIYVSGGAGAIRDISYDLARDAYGGDDLTLLAAHLFRDRMIIDMAYLEEPGRRLFVLFDDGKAAVLTYLREQEVLAWSRFETNGKILSLERGKRRAADRLWIIVKRQNGVFVEKLEDGFDYDPAKQIYLDNCAVQEYDEPTSTLSGLEAFDEADEVHVLADGKFIEGLYTDNGTLSLPFACKRAVIGLGYNSEIETLPTGQNTQSGSLMPAKKHISGAAVKLLNTVRGEIGTRITRDVNEPPDENANRFWPIDNRQNPGQPPQIYTALKKIALTCASHEEATLAVRQREPYSMEISALTASVEF